VIDALPVRRRLIGATLRRYREHLGYGLEEAARVLECDRSKISRIETGQRGIRPRDLRDLLSEYGISESEQVTLAAIADPRITRRGWWQEYADIVPTSRMDYLLMETLASEILAYDTQQIPELLQTPHYARAVAEADPDMLEPGTLDRLTEMRVVRQRMIKGDHGATLSVIVGEGALRQLVGGADVMREQLRWLVQLGGTCQRVAIQVVPFGSGAHPNGGSGSMTILRFAEAQCLGVVHLPGLGGGVCLVDPADVAAHLRAFTQLQVSALPPHQSTRMLREMAE
jgi:transcriptional regulator with XRE-family HTH domain